MTTKTKTPEAVKLWRAEQKLDGTNAMAEYKQAEGTAREHLAKLRTERVALEADAESRKAAAVKAHGQTEAPKGARFKITNPEPLGT
jgi:hypothetical protein